MPACWLLGQTGTNAVPAMCRGPPPQLPSFNQNARLLVHRAHLQEQILLQAFAARSFLLAVLSAAKRWPLAMQEAFQCHSEASNAPPPSNKKTPVLLVVVPNVLNLW